MVSKLLATGLFLTPFIQSITAVSFPLPRGPYNTSLLITSLTDKARTDPFSPTKEHRSIVVSVFNPVSPSACSPILVPYMDTTTAAFEDAKFSQYGLPTGTFPSLQLHVCQAKSTARICPKPKHETFPIVLFTTALGTTRLLYNAMAQQVASSGYTVIMIDHPYDADVVTFPDNTTITEGTIDTDEQVLLAINTRVKDISFVLNTLARSSGAKQLLPGSTSGIDVSKVGIFGHSLGGAAAAEAMLYDSRLAGGINLDGTFFGKVVAKGLKKPFLIFGHEGKNTTTDDSWAAIWPKLTGWKRMFMLNGAAHYGFSDLPAMINVLGIRDQLPEEVSQLLGTIDGDRAMEIVTTYVAAFFDKVLKGKKNALLDGPNKKFPEVTIGSP